MKPSRYKNLVGLTLSVLPHFIGLLTATGLETQQVQILTEEANSFRQPATCCNIVKPGWLATDSSCSLSQAQTQQVQEPEGIRMDKYISNLDIYAWTMIPLGQVSPLTLTGW